MGFAGSREPVKISKGDAHIYVQLRNASQRKHFLKHVLFSKIASPLHAEVAGLATDYGFMDHGPRCDAIKTGDILAREDETIVLRSCIYLRVFLIARPTLGNGLFFAPLLVSEG